jgi:hypothetical protein
LARGRDGVLTLISFPGKKHSDALNFLKVM